MRVTRTRIIIAALATVALVTGCAGQALPKGDYGTIHGIVKNQSGAPGSGASVTLDTVLTASTGSDGSYTLSTVPADDSNTSTSVSVAASGYASQTQSVKVTAGQTTEVDFTLQP